MTTDETPGRGWMRPACAGAAALVVALAVAGTVLAGRHDVGTAAAAGSSGPGASQPTVASRQMVKTPPGPSTPESPANKATMTSPPTAQTEPPPIPGVVGPQAAKDVDGLVAKRVTPTGGWGLLCGPDLFYYLVAGRSVDSSDGALAVAVSNGWGDIRGKDVFLSQPGTTSLTIKDATCSVVTLRDASGAGFSWVPGTRVLVPR